MPPSLTHKLSGLRGLLIDAPQRGKLRVVRDGALLVDGGRIAAAGPWGEVRDSAGDARVHWAFGPETILIPGLVDTHCHLPQYPAVARREAGLMPWHQRAVFPLEHGFNAATAREQAPLFFEALARHGTTTASVYAATSAESCEEAFIAAERGGMRILMGKIMADVGVRGKQPPDKILATSVEESQRLCRRWNGKDGGRIRYAFSPRSAAACSEAMMRAAARLAGEEGAYVQTHLSENPDEIAAVAKSHPWASDYADIYARCGLLGPRAILGQCIHLSSEEIARLAATRAVVAHCPTSNFFLGSGIMPLDRLLAAGLRVGLGSDVAAGPELNLWQVMRSMIEAQQARSFSDREIPVPSPGEAFFHATQGGAEALDLGAVVGTLDVGKEADVVALDLGQVVPYGRKKNLTADLGAEEILSLLVYRGGPGAVMETFVRGRPVYRAPASILL